MMLTVDEYMALRRLIDSERESEGVDLSRTITAPVSAPKKRRVSKYQRRFGIELKALKKKHPRTKLSALMRRAHSATKRALK